MNPSQEDMAKWSLSHRKAYAVYNCEKKGVIVKNNEPCATYIMPHKVKETEYRRMYKYGLTPEMFNAIFEKQDGKCAICKKADWGKKGWCIDHDHVIGKVRGLLCMNCNVALGHVDDNPKIARAMADYLEGEGGIA